MARLFRGSLACKVDDLVAVQCVLLNTAQVGPETADVIGIDCVLEG